MASRGDANGSRASVGRSVSQSPIRHPTVPRLSLPDGNIRYQTSPPNTPRGSNSCEGPNTPNTHSAMRTDTQVTPRFATPREGASEGVRDSARDSARLESARRRQRDSVISYIQRRRSCTSASQLSSGGSDTGTRKRPNPLLEGRRAQTPTSARRSIASPDCSARDLSIISTPGRGTSSNAKNRRTSEMSDMVRLMTARPSIDDDARRAACHNDMDDAERAAFPSPEIPVISASVVARPSEEKTSNAIALASPSSNGAPPQDTAAVPTDPSSTRCNSDGDKISELCQHGKQLAQHWVREFSELRANATPTGTPAAPQSSAVTLAGDGSRPDLQVAPSCASFSGAEHSFSGQTHQLEQLKFRISHLELTWENQDVNACATSSRCSGTEVASLRRQLEETQMQLGSAEKEIRSAKDQIRTLHGRLDMQTRDSCGSARSVIRSFVEGHDMRPIELCGSARVSTTSATSAGAANPAPPAICDSSAPNPLVHSCPAPSASVAVAVGGTPEKHPGHAEPARIETVLGRAISVRREISVERSPAVITCPSSPATARSVQRRPSSSWAQDIPVGCCVQVGTPTVPGGIPSSACTSAMPSPVGTQRQVSSQVRSAPPQQTLMATQRSFTPRPHVVMATPSGGERAAPLRATPLFGLPPRIVSPPMSARVCVAEPTHGMKQDDAIGTPCLAAPGTVPTVHCTPVRTKAGATPARAIRSPRLGGC